MHGVYKIYVRLTRGFHSFSLMVTYYKLGDILPSLWTMRVIKIEGGGESIMYVGLAYYIRYM